MIVQIYEVQSPEEARLMVELGVDHIGSVLLAEQQWQNEALKRTVAAVRSAGRKSSLIPLFCNVDLITRAIDYYQPDIIHFCETLSLTGPGCDELHQTMERQKEIRTRFPKIEIMRSIPIVVAGAGIQLPSLEIAALFEPISDWFLTDTVLVDHAETPAPSDQPVSGFVGITGQTCDWGVARDLVARSAIPVILAGGISPGNVVEGVEAVHPAGVDSCTQTNLLDDRGRPIRFRKDPEKVRTMVNAVRKTGERAAAGDPSSHRENTDAASTQ